MEVGSVPKRAPKVLMVSVAIALTSLFSILANSVKAFWTSNACSLSVRDLSALTASLQIASSLKLSCFIIGIIARLSPKLASALMIISAASGVFSSIFIKGTTARLSPKAASASTARSRTHQSSSSNASTSLS